jgi:2,3-dihydroxybiphenyl 1,2-dioxygenase
MASVSQLGYLVIKAKDLQAWKSYAAEILGMSCDDSEEGTLFLRMDDRSHRFIIEQGDQDDLGAVGWQVRNEESFDEIKQQIEAAGISPTVATEDELRARHVLGLMRFTDPGGVPIELFYGAEIGRGFYYPGRAISSFKSGYLGLGSVTLNCPDVRSAVRFYSETLGFRLSNAKVDWKTAYLRCNPRHHSLTLVENANPPKVLNSFSVEYNNVNDVGSVLTIAERRGDKVAGTLGRHIHDRLVSLYVYTPSGFMAELGWDGREVDEETWKVEVFTDDTTSYWGHKFIGNAELGLQLV